MAKVSSQNSNDFLFVCLYFIYFLFLFLFFVPEKKSFRLSLVELVEPSACHLVELISIKYQSMFSWGKKENCFI